MGKHFRPRDQTSNYSSRLIDRRDAARMLGVSPGTIDNLRLRGELASVKIACRRLYDVADLEHFIASRKTTARPADRADGGTGVGQ